MLQSASDAVAARESVDDFNVAAEPGTVRVAWAWGGDSRAKEIMEREVSAIVAENFATLANLAKARIALRAAAAVQTALETKT